MLGGSTLLEGRAADLSRPADGKQPVESDAQSMDVRKMIAFVGATYFLLMTAFVVPVACVSTVAILTPILLFSRPLFISLEQRLCRMVNEHWVAGAAHVGMTVSEFGDNIDALEDKKCLFLANHLGLIDHFLIMTALHDKARVPGSWMWVIYNIWKYTPLGAMWTTHGNFFVNGGAKQRESLLETFKQHLLSNFWKYEYSWVVMYPEGSRLFLAKESGARFAEKNGLHVLEHVIYPRTGAAHAVLDVTAPSHADPSVSVSGGRPVEYIIDATLGYPKGDVPDIGNVILGDFPNNDGRLSIHYRVVKVLPEWREEEKLKEVMYKMYEEKDALLASYYSTGRFPGEDRPVVVQPARSLFSQVFWLGLYYVHYYAWIKPLFTAATAALFALF